MPIYANTKTPTTTFIAIYGPKMRTTYVQELLHVMRLSVSSLKKIAQNLVIVKNNQFFQEVFLLKSLVSIKSDQKLCLHIFFESGYSCVRGVRVIFIFSI